MEDHDFQIEELSAKAQQWRTEKRGDLALLRSERELKLLEFDTELNKLEEERRFKEDLYKGLKSIDSSGLNYTPISDKIESLEKQKELALGNIDLEIKNIQEEIRLGMNPFQVEIKRLRAEHIFEQDNKVVEVELVAPSKGVVGNINCKRAEHIPSFKTLMSFYEPNPTQVKGYIHEDQILEVGMADSLVIRSTKDENIFCKGKVNGLGSRIVEIPERLRKIPDLKIYGREILVSIPPSNNFLQKEKVGLEIIE